MAKAAAKKAPTKSEVFSNIAESTDLNKKQVAAVFDALHEEIRKALGRNGPKAFTIPDLCKITVKNKPATAKKKGVNRFTGEEVWFKAKPASKQVKIRPFKALKDMA